MRKRSFSQALGVLLVFWIVAEVILGLTRNPIADRYRGDVFILTAGKAQKVNDVQVRVDLIDKGLIVGNRPFITHDGMRVEFTGKGADQLVRLGLPRQYVSPEGDGYFRNGFCQFGRVKTSAGEPIKWMPVKEFVASSYTRYFDFTFDKNDKHPCRPASFGLLDFSHAEVMLPLGRFMIVGSLERDSYISPLQRIVMWVSNDTKSLGAKNDLTGTGDF